MGAAFFCGSDGRDTLDARERQGRRIIKSMQRRRRSDPGEEDILQVSNIVGHTVTLRKRGAPNIVLGGESTSTEVRLLHRFRIKRFLGSGTYSQVFLAIPHSEEDCSKIISNRVTVLHTLPMKRESILNLSEGDAENNAEPRSTKRALISIRKCLTTAHHPLGHFGKRLPPLQSVAVKIIPRNTASKEYEAQMLEEAKTLKLVGTHPHIIRLLEFVRSERNFFMVMEAAPHNLVDTLVTLHKDDRSDFLISERTIRPLFRQLFGALSFVHGMGIAHLDIKPDNLLIGADGSVRLADFGLAMRVPGYRPCHTLLFCPPEILRERRAYAVSDIWASGCLLFLLLTGYFPFNLFEHERTVRLETRILSGLSDATIEDAVMSKRARDLIRTCLLVQDPCERSAAF